MDRQNFESLVYEALKDIPKELKKKMENIEIVIEDWAREKGLPQKRSQGSTYLGLYQGVPLSKRGPYYSFILPDKITLFQKAIESISANREELKETVRKVVIHEIGHHFGLNEKQLSDT
jgi:predicted Zn-dependent protease with MMP-like domain